MLPPAMLPPTIVTSPAAESSNKRSAAEEVQHRVVDLLDRALNGEDPLSETSDAEGDLLEHEESVMSSLNVSRHSSSSSTAGRARRRSLRRKSSFGGDLRTDMFATIRKHRLEPEELANLLRRYYEQDKELRRWEADLEEVQLPLDFDSLTPAEAADQLVQLMDEVEELYDELPQKSGRSHQADLDRVLLLLKNEYNKVGGLASMAEGQIMPQTEEQKAIVASARSINQKIREIEALNEELRGKLDELAILQNLA